MLAGVSTTKVLAGGVESTGPALAQNEECRSPRRCEALLLALSSSTRALLLNLEIAVWGCGLSWLAATCHLPKCLSRGPALKPGCSKAGGEAKQWGPCVTRGKAECLGTGGRTRDRVKDPCKT